VDVKIRENPFLKEKISLGRPDIKPEKATFMPVVKDIPQTKRPPEPIREIRTKELKEKRPLVREKESSVFRPGSPSKEMQLKVREVKPPEKGAPSKPTGIKQPEREKIEKPKVIQPSGGDSEIIKESRPPERGVQKTVPAGKAIEKPREGRPPEAQVEKQGERRQLEREDQRQRKPKEIEREKEKSQK